MRKSALALGLVASLVSPTQAVLGRDFIQVTNFDIAGAKLGMDQNQIAASLKAEGYQRTQEITSGSTWNDEVGRRLALAGRGGSMSRKDAAQLSEQYYAKGPSTVIVNYTALPAGGLVASQIRYRLAPTVMTPETFAHQAIGKYGEPSHSTSYNHIYCSTGEKQCSANYIVAKATLPHLLVQSADTSLALLLGTKAETEREAAIKEEMDRRAPPARAAF